MGREIPGTSPGMTGFMLLTGRFFQRGDFLKSKPGILRNLGYVQSVGEHRFCDLGTPSSSTSLNTLLNTLLYAFVSGEGDLVPNVSFRGHIVQVFDLFLGSKIR